jgi:mannosyltransferase
MTTPLRADNLPEAAAPAAPGAEQSSAPASLWVRLRPWLLLAAILLLATGLRLWQLERHALWWDEGNNAYFALQSPQRILEMSRLTNDTNPPVHRLALGLWLRLLGPTARNLRLLSVVCGVLTVPIAFYWGRRLGGPRAGLLAALLLACAPAAIYYSREAKGYPWVTLWSWTALTLLGTVTGKAARARPWGERLALWCGYVAASGLALGAHYYVLLVQLAEGLWLLARVAQEWRELRRPRLWAALGRLAPFGLAQLAILALVAPWARATWQTAYGGALAIPLESDPLAVGRYLSQMALRLVGGPNPPARPAWLAVGACAAAGALALWAALRHKQARPEAQLMLAVAVVPVLAGILVQLWATIVIARFLLFAVPALCVLAGAGLARWPRRTLPLLLALAAGWALCLPGAYAAPAPPEEDLRPLAETLAAYARPRDAVVVSYIWQEGTLRLYAPGVRARWQLGWYTDENVAGEMSGLLEKHPSLWLVSYQQPLQHPSNQAGWWLEQHAVRVLAQEQGPTRLARYAPPCAVVDPTPRAELTNGVSLAAMPVPRNARPGDVLSVGLAWGVTAALPPETTVFVQLLGPDGALMAQADGDPQNGLAPLSTVSPGTAVQDCRALLVPADAGPGGYTLIAGMYDRASGLRVPVSQPDGASADHVLLGQIQVTAP